MSQKDFIHCSGVSIDDVEELNAGWEYWNWFVRPETLDKTLKSLTLSAISSLQDQVGNYLAVFSVLPDFQYPFSTYLKFSEKLTLPTLWYASCTCAYKAVRNISFSYLLKFSVCTKWMTPNLTWEILINDLINISLDTGRNSRGIDKFVQLPNAIVLITRRS